MSKDTKYTVKYTETFIQFVLLVIKKKNAGKKHQLLFQMVSTNVCTLFYIHLKTVQITLVFRNVQ